MENNSVRLFNFASTRIHFCCEELALIVAIYICTDDVFVSVGEMKQQHVDPVVEESSIVGGAVTAQNSSPPVPAAAEDAASPDDSDEEEEDEEEDEGVAVPSGSEESSVCFFLPVIIAQKQKAVFVCLAQSIITHSGTAVVMQQYYKQDIYR